MYTRTIPLPLLDVCLLTADLRTSLLPESCEPISIINLSLSHIHMVVDEYIYSIFLSIDRNCVFGERDPIDFASLETSNTLSVSELHHLV